MLKIENEGDEIMDHQEKKESFDYDKLEVERMIDEYNASIKTEDDFPELLGRKATVRVFKIMRTLMWISLLISVEIYYKEHNAYYDLINRKPFRTGRRNLPITILPTLLLLTVTKWLWKKAILCSIGITIVFILNLFIIISFIDIYPYLELGIKWMYITNFYSYFLCMYMTLVPSVRKYLSSLPKKQWFDEKPKY